MTDHDPPEKPYISHSQLNLYTNCGEAYRRRYIERHIIPPGVAALRGRGVHAAAEINHAQKVESHVDLPLTDMVDAAAAAFDETRKREGVQLNVDEESQGAAIVIGAAKDSAVRLTGLYAQAVAPTIQPAAGMVEARIRIDLPESPVDMLGVIDVATVDDRVIDLKTKARAESQGAADSSHQLTWYAMTFRALTGRDATSLDLEVLIAGAKSRHQRLSTSRTRRDYEVLVNRVNQTLRGIQAGTFQPAAAGFWLCSPKWCGYWRTCKYVNAERTAAAEAD